MIGHLLEPYISDRFLSDESYRKGHIGILNPLPGTMVLGLHIPEMKNFVRQQVREGSGESIIAGFESAPAGSLCHEEKMVWGFILNKVRIPQEKRLEHFAAFIPQIDNWAVCDSVCSDAKWADASLDRTWEFLHPYYASDREFEVRFAVVMSMCHFLREEWLDSVFSKIDALDFGKIISRYVSVRYMKTLPEDEASELKKVCGTALGESPYYVKMAVAWFLATSLAKFPEQTRSFMAVSSVPEDVRRLYVRKAKESFRTRDMSPF